MRTKNFLKHLILGGLLLMVGKVEGQSTTPGNVANLATDFLGWNNNAGNNFPLMVRHDLNQPIEFYTDSIQRMQLWNTSNSNINGYGANAIRQNGFVGISNQPLFFSNAPGAFSRLHLCDSTSDSQQDFAQQFGYRNWMRNGITFTGNSDQGYIGQQYVGPDATDMVIQWSDNPQTHPWASDRLKIVFASNRIGGTATGMNCEQGMEAMRFWPANPNNVNVGVGDFFRAGIVNAQLEDPTERLHVNDGTIRIDSLVPDYNNDTLSRVAMVDSLGRLHWRRINTFPGGGGGPDCDWTLLGSPGSNSNIATAYTSNPGCPQDNRNVGIGTASPSAKLHVERSLANSTGLQRGGYFNLTGNNATGNKIGVHAIATGTGQQNIGVKAEGNGGGTTNYGLQADANGTGTTSSPDTGTRYGVFGTSVQGAKRSYGVRGFGGWATQMTCGVRAEGNHGPSGIAKPDSIFGVWANCGNSISRSFGVFASSGVASGATGIPGNSYGVYCEVGPSVGSNATSYGLYAKRPWTGASNNNWAGWFDGNVMINGNGYLTGMVPITSDGNLKTNVAELGEADSLLRLLAPKRYEFLTDEFPDLGLAEGEQWGFIAQDVEEVMPDLVKHVMVPAFHDSLGNQTQPAMELRTLNYMGLIPLLVAGYQEQAATIAQQQAANNDQAAELNELRSRLDQLEEALAACCAAPNDDGTRMLSDPQDGIEGDERALAIRPNPFNERTTLYYTLERNGRMQLMANSADGKQLRVLREANLEAGEYQHEWQTSDLTPGIYYVTLLLDGEPIVKKAVKVQR